MTRNTSARLILAWITALLGVGWILVQVGHGSLAAPPTASGLGPLRQWASARDAQTMAMSAVRLLALVLDAYLLATIVVGAAARLSRSAAAVRTADLVTPPSVRRLLGTTLGGLVLSASVSAPIVVPSPWQQHPAAWQQHAAAWQPHPAALSPLSTSGVGGPPLVHAAGAEPPLLRLIPPSAAPPRVVPGTVRGPSPDPRPPPASVPLPPPPPRVVPPPEAARPLPPTTTTGRPTLWTVRPGENFWAIARAAMTPNTGPAQIAPYWRVVIDANRERLGSRDPSVIYAGEQFFIPPPPP